jgi:P27 family predicted phage terminase small subunit
MIRPNNVIPLNANKNIGEDESKSDLFQGLVGEAPTCPSWLNPESKKHFKFLVAELKKSGLIAKIDQGALSILGVSYARMMEAEKNIQLHGETQTSPNGYVQESPWATLWAKHSKAYERLCVKFGVTVAGRQRVKIDNPNQGALDL